MKPAEGEFPQDIKATFVDLEARMEASRPGILELLRAYGDAEDAIRQASAYLAMMEPLRVVDTTNTSGG